MDKKDVRDLDDSLNVLIRKVAEVNEALLYDWCQTLDGGGDLLQRAKDEIRKTMLSTDQNVNFITRLMSEEPHGYRDRSGKYTTRVNLAMLFLYLMNDDILGSHSGTQFWNSVRKDIKKVCDKLDLATAPLVRTATKSRLTFEQIKEKYRPRDAISPHEAARLEDADAVKTQLSKGDVITTDRNGYTPLHFAAMAINPNAQIAGMLVQAMKKQHRRNMINKAGNKASGRNTALHIAAENVNVTQEFIDELRDADPSLINGRYDTPFHVAAKSRNPNAILYLLNTFAPTNNRWDVDYVDECKDPRCNDTLIDICARSGNAEAVALLIQHGADISKGVLHVIVIESVRNPEKVEQLKSLYEVIVDNAVTWRCLEHNVPSPSKGSLEYISMLQETMIWLITRPLEWHDNEDVLQCAITHGALAMYQQIMNTENVFRIYVKDSGHRYLHFDVTNFTREMMVERASSNSVDTETNDQRADFLFEKPEESYRARRPRRNFQTPRVPERPYLNHLLSCFERWKSTDILSARPLRQLMEPYVTFTQRLYFLLGLLQLIFMVLFSVFYMPDSCSLSLMFNINITHCSSSSSSTSITTEQRSSPPVFWLVWPIVLLISNSVTHYGAFKGANVAFKGSDRNSDEVNFVTNYFPLASKLCVSFLRPVLLKIFCCMVFVWFYEYRNSENHKSYVVVTSMVFLFGWVANLDFFGAVNKNFSISVLVVQEIIAKDVPFFTMFYLFTVVGFSFAMHALRMRTCEVSEFIYLWETFHGVLSSGFGIGDFFSSTVVSRPSCVDSATQMMFITVHLAYIGVTVIILLNILIAMMTNRYELTRRRAETIWRFRIFYTMSALERVKIFEYLMMKLLYLCRPGWGYRDLCLSLLRYFGLCIHDSQDQFISKTEGYRKGRNFLVLPLDVEQSKVDHL